MSLQPIRKRALAGSLEVEHLLREAKLGTPGLGPLLLQLSEQLGWSLAELEPDGSRQVPLAAWATVIAAYSNAGFPGLQSLASDSALATFVVGLAEELKTAKSLAFLLQAFASAIARPERDLEVSFRLAQALNLMLSFKPAAPVKEDQAEVIQLFLFRLHQLARTEAEAAVALLALRGFGTPSAAVG